MDLGFVLLLFFGLGVFSRAICLVWGVGGATPARPGPEGTVVADSHWGPADGRPRAPHLITGPFLFPEEMPYLKCPLHTVLKLTPVAYGECGDAAPRQDVPLGRWLLVAVGL